MRCALGGAPSETYNLASGRETTIAELAAAINGATENPTPPWICCLPVTGIDPESDLAVPKKLSPTLALRPRLRFPKVYPDWLSGPEKTRISFAFAWIVTLLSCPISLRLTRRLQYFLTTVFS